MNFISHLCDRTLKRIKAALPVIINILYINIDIFIIIYLKLFHFYITIYPYVDNQTIYSKLSLVGKVTFLKEFLPNVCESNTVCL